MSAIIGFTAANWTEIVALAAAIHAAALIVVNLTPTPKDNAAYAKFYKVVEVLAGIVTKLAKK